FYYSFYVPMTEPVLKLLGKSKDDNVDDYFRLRRFWFVAPKRQFADMTKGFSIPAHQRDIVGLGQSGTGIVALKESRVKLAGSLIRYNVTYEVGLAAGSDEIGNAANAAVMKEAEADEKATQ